MKPAGLSYIKDVISSEEEKELIEYITEKVPLENWSFAGKRRVLHFGYTYNYIQKNIKKHKDDIPEIFKKTLLTDSFLKVVDKEKEYFNQCIINEYIAEKSQGIGWHTDLKEVFGDTIACFTLGSGCEMCFKRNKDEKYSLNVAPQSVYIMSGESRYDWEHSMPSRKKDNGVLRKGIRYSFTFRNAIDV